MYPQHPPVYPVSYHPPRQHYPQPSGVTATVAALGGFVAAALGGIGCTIVADAASEVTATGSSDWHELNAMMVVVAATSALYALGGLLMLARMASGRVLLIGLPLLGLIGSAISILISLRYDGAMGNTLSGVGLGVALQLTILFAASAASTGRWLAAGRRYAPHQ